MAGLKAEPGLQAKRPAFAGAAAVTYGSAVGAALLSFANVLLMSRVLGPAGRGDVALLTTIAIFTANVGLLGVEEANVNLAGREPRLRRALLGNSVLLAAFFGCVGIGVVAGLTAAVPAIGGDASSSLRWLALGAVPVLILQTYLHFLLQADYRFLLINAALLLPPALSLVVNGALAAAGSLSVASVMGAWLAGQLLTAVLLLRQAFRAAGGVSRPDLALARSTLGFGLKSHPGRIMNLANYRLDQWIVAGVAGSHELGLYSVAVSWGETLFFLPTALATVQRPDLVRDSREAAGPRAARVFRSAALLTLPLAGGLVLLAPFLCATIFGEEFRGSIDDLRVLAVGGLGIAALKLLGDALIAQRRPLLTTGAVGVAFAVTILLDVALIPPFGGLGAAAASAAAYTAAGVAVAVVFLRTLGGAAADLVPRRSDAGLLWRRLRALVPRGAQPR